MSCKNLADFRLDLTKFQQEIMPQAHNAFCRRVALQLLRDIIMGTPVDTGLARGNWQVTAGEPAMSVVELLDKVGDSTLSIGSSMISNIDFTKQRVWITNNLPYIESLEDGHSKSQAPNGWVEFAVLKLQMQAGLV